jgi:hypothetical protein
LLPARQPCDPQKQALRYAIPQSRCHVNPSVSQRPQLYSLVSINTLSSLDVALDRSSYPTIDTGSQHRNASPTPCAKRITIQYGVFSQQPLISTMANSSAYMNWKRPDVTSSPTSTTSSIDAPSSPSQKSLSTTSTSHTRTFSDPVFPYSSRPISDSMAPSSRGSKRTEMPRSAGHRSPMNEVKGERCRSGSKKTSLHTPGSPTHQGPDQKTKRRYSHEPKVNLYTECGRHSDDWLFGGFALSDAVKKIWGKKE